ncbi:hypothetical protein DICPUDRAFT_75973 [Dictyostelium purpureum]|uniref:Proteasome subunit beta n=1 Tax=Dictyostelium purpureum TaxID=5786 RepID=F0ZC77_DICPU|nr:uncharacterized protein DICPUDRAFT_75973 [Dictyostelium purpureum]EGC38450.1 hypothetical protein DICPUDRAFT_75973 [Dictyostelium purpureum]|eukprot:XP_003285008.1 hypothetical protein DICPUDRAFT_75973 [Dictyostelium purpureum]
MSFEHINFPVFGQVDYFGKQSQQQLQPQQQYTPSHGGKKNTLDPIVTGTSIIAIKYDKGVVMGSDMLLSYGSLARFNSIQRMTKFGGNTIIGASGEYSDFQSITTTLNELVTDDHCMDDGSRLSPEEIWNYLARILYNQRNKGNPLWNTCVVIGYQGGKSFLGKVDLVGTCFKEDIVTCGYGSHIALPLLRKARDDNPNMNLEQAKKLIEDCLRVLFYRDARSSKKIQIAVAGEQGIDISGPIELETYNWNSGEAAVKNFSQV